ncbi:hypothetical protein [Methanimicrococcus hacksteinii]|uniref:hypothetical protein n=1 Tax=Methanimicrococcus hacksteinii TaxID=3028293 RepID=UPI00298F3536|nr:hypothetical protein [Methanimicrococcus sp. At1]
MISAIFILGMLSPACAGSDQKTSLVISDSVSPMRLEVDAGSTAAETETKTVTLTNTGETENTYIFYIESGGSDKSNAEFELSETKATVLPGETYSLEISIPVSKIKNSADESKLKIIRNPDTQTPVGYIIPIEISGTENKNENETGSKTENKTGSKTGSKSGSLISGETETGKTDTEENKNSNLNQTGSKNTVPETENHPENETVLEKSEEKKMTEKIIFISLIALLLLFTAAGIQIQKRKKKET